MSKFTHKKKSTLEDVPKLIESLTAMTAKGFERIDGRIDKLDGRIDKLDGRMDKLDGRMDKMDGRMDKLEGRMGRLEVAVEDGFEEMRDMYAEHDTRINKLEDRAVGL